MKTVTNDFKTTVKGDVKDLYATISDGVETITESGDLKAIKIIANGDICSTVMRQAEIKVWGSYDWKDKEVNIKIGVDVNGTPEYIDYGDFTVTEVDENKANEERTLKLFDKMHEALVPYERGADYPKTVLELLQEICTELGWILATTTFTHSDLSITSELFSNQNLSYRDVLEDIAEISGTIMLFNEDDELELREVDTTTVLETLTTNDVFSLNLKEEWGPLNSLVLAREPQEDNIVEQDETSITNNGLWELRIANNRIVDDDRETYITDIYNTVEGIDYRAFESKTIGLGYLEIGDVIKVTDKSSNESVVLITDVEVNVTGGITDSIKGRIPSKSTTNYNTAGIIGKRIRRTEIIVDKQEGEIQNLVDNTTAIVQNAEQIGLIAQEGLETAELADLIARDGLQMAEIAEALAQQGYDKAEENEGYINTMTADITLLQQRADSLDISVTQFGGSNLLKNSSGLKGSLEEWVLSADNYEGAVIENFEGTELSDDWIAWRGETDGIDVTNNVLTLTTEDGPDYQNRGVVAENLFDMNQGGVSVKIDNVSTLTGYANFEMVFMDFGYPQVYSLNIGVDGTEVTTAINKGSGWSTVATTTLGSNKYFRIRVENSIAYYEMSEDNYTWTEIARESYEADLSENKTSLWIWDEDNAGSAEYSELTYWRYADPLNDGEIIQDTEVEMNTESGSAIEVDERYIVQNVPTIPDQLYTFYCRMKKRGTVTLEINGEYSEALEPDDYTDEEWASFKYQFTALNENTAVKIDATTTDAWIVIGDMVLKLGDANGWVQAPNEVYGKNFRFDREGFSITSQTDNFMSQLDNTKLAVYDTTGGGRRDVMVVSKDSGKISSLLAQETFSIQRYENPTARVRFIPTDTGCMVVVND
jgi:hypothetical protein